MLRTRTTSTFLAPITLHECHHTFASLMIAAGVNAKALGTNAIVAWQAGKATCTSVVFRA
jgi:hypothetical protein